MFSRKRARQKLLFVVKGKASFKARTLKKCQGLKSILGRAKEQPENLNNVRTIREIHLLAMKFLKYHSEYSPL